MVCIRGAWHRDEPGASSVKRILIVEDNPDLRSLLLDAVDDAGYDVRAVGNGAEALELAGTWRPDEIFTIEYL